MKKVLYSIVTIGIAISSYGQVNFSDYFIEKTMRLDYYHAGDATHEYFFVDEVIEEPHWAGNKNYLVDERNIGSHRFKIIDKAS